MYDDPSLHEDSPDSLDQFLAQLLADIPEFLTTPIAALPPQPPSPPSTSTSPLTSSAAAHQASTAHLTCQWVSISDPHLVCGEALSPDPKHACNHFRNVHDVRGNEKVIIPCQWHDCQVPPMQRGSLIRHVLSVHLGLLRWRCGSCGRIFSRKGTGHACSGSPEGG